MSARLLTVLILPTLLLAAALSPSRAAQQHPEPVKPAKPGKGDKPQLVSKVYQVTDLVIPLIACEAAPKDETKSCATCTRSQSTSAIELYMREHCKACPKAKCLKKTGDTCEQQLINLIQSTISPMAWNDAGGDWSLEYFPLTHALVVNAPPDAQEQIMELLAALRRLQDQEVALEVRFLQVSDDFYKRLKTDFELKDSKDGPMASLDDTQLSKFLEAGQCDKQTHIMQAPKITMFNGQQSTVRVLETRFFTSKLEMLKLGECTCPTPINEAVQLGMEMGLNPVICTDHRSVKLDLNFKNTRLESEDIELIPMHFVMTKEPGCKCPDGILKLYQPVKSTEKMPQPSKEELEKFKDKNAVIFTQYIQKPKIAKVSFERKLNLPEGKTAVLFGWKQTSEVTDAVPVLSKLPWIGKQYQHKRQVPETVLVLVTPRVIVPKEEEERATGTGIEVLQHTEEVLPAPKPVQVKAAPSASSDAEESELKTVERVWNEWYKAEIAEKNVNELMAKYHKLCAAGRKDAARKVALKALKIDPTCFDRK
jgi:hypothetical protein